MNKELTMLEIAHLISQKTMRVFSKLQEQPQQLTRFVEKNLKIWLDMHQLAWLLTRNQPILQEIFLRYAHAVLELLHNQTAAWQQGQMPAISDKRFNHEDWVTSPFYNLLSQHYLLCCHHVDGLWHQLGDDDQTTLKQLHFFCRQYLDALSPDNFIHTNPQLIKETIQSQGKNWLLGLCHLLDDIAANAFDFNIPMVEKEHFTVGRNIAITPGKVIFRNDLMELIQYTPQTTSVHAIPLLIIPPWINKYYILDLSPRNSLICWLVSQGITVFTISWVNPNKSHANTGLDKYLQEGPVIAIETIQKQLQISQVNALGFCIGGTLLAMLLAYYQQQPTSPVNAATFLATMIDFTDPGDMSIFIDEPQIAALEEHMQSRGFLAGNKMASAFNALRARDLIWSFFIKRYLQAQKPPPFDILYWNTDSTNMPAKMHIEYLRWMYLQNDLVKPNKLSINGRFLDVTQITTSTFFIGTERDHIAPWKTTYLGFQLMAGKKQFLLGGSGHIAGIVIPPGTEKYGFYKNLNNPIDPEKWLANASHHSGSWWPEWFEWLKNESGALQQAPNFCNLPLPALMDAPGSYVLQTH